MNQAIELIQLQKYAEALKILTDLINKEPKNGLILGEAAFCHAQLGNLCEAEKNFSLAAKYHPEDPWIWQHYGYVLFQAGKAPAAIDALKKAVKFKPDDIMSNHQLGFLYYQNNKYKEALKYIDKALELARIARNIPQVVPILTLKARMCEFFDKKTALESYYALIQLVENEASAYDRISSLIIDKFTFSKNLDDLNQNTTEYNKATQYLRKGELDKAIDTYKQVTRQDKSCYPAFLGIAQSLYEKYFGAREIPTYSAPEEISVLFRNYDQLNEIEKNIIHASVKPLEHFIKKLNEVNSHFVIVPIDAKLTDYPANMHLNDKDYLTDTPFHTLRGIGGDNGYVGVERIRDFLWKVPISLKFIPACVAHEFGHQVWCLLDSKTQNKVENLYKQAKKAKIFLSNYSQENVQEYFAEYYAYYSRLASLDEKLPKDPMIEIITELKNYTP